MPALALAVKGEAKRLHLHLRPGDEMSIPITSSATVKTTRLLLRVRTKRGAVAGVDVVGTVPKTFEFGGLADFQYLTRQVMTGREGGVSKTRVSYLRSPRIICPKP